jgi:hypothetical protein
MDNILEQWIWFYYDICGFSIIPLKEKDKRPNIPSWDKYKETRPTREEIQEWINKDLFQNIAIICGHVSNDLVVIDFDDEKIPEEIGLDFNKTIEKGMWVIRTGKGYHVYAKHTGDPGGIEKSLQLKIEYRANNGYVAAPPSIHPNGSIYHFLNNETPPNISTLQNQDAKIMWKELKTALKKKRGIKEKKERIAETSAGDYPACVQKALQDVVIEKGNRYYILYGLSSFLKQAGVPRDIAMTKIKTWNMIKCVPPHSNQIVEQGMNGAYDSDKKTGCTFWDEQADMCPYESKEECSYINKPEKKSKEKKITEETTKIIVGDILYEQVYNPITFETQFCSLNDGEPHYVPNVEYNGITYLPVNDRKAIEMGAIYFPDVPMEYGSLKQLIQEIDEFVKTYMDVSDLFRIFSTWYIVFSWVTDKINTVPYLRVVADFGTGKSRYLHTVGKLCYKPMVVAGATTTACIFRSIERWKGTLLLEEYNPKESGEVEDETKILNCGFERNNPVSRCDKETGKLNYFDTFGPKVISSRHEFKDPALNSRCLTEVLRETNRKDIPILLPQEFYWKQQELRNKLLLYRLHNWNDIDPKRIKDVVFPDTISKRLKQAFSSFVVLFLDDEEAKKMFMDYVTKYNQKIIEEQSQSFDGTIINAFFELKKDSFSFITSQMISEQMATKGIKTKAGEPIATRSIGRHLKTLGLESKSKTIDGKTYRVVVEDAIVLDSLKRKYVFIDVESGLEIEQKKLD